MNKNKYNSKCMKILKKNMKFLLQGLSFFIPLKKNSYLFINAKYRNLKSRDNIIPIYKELKKDSSNYVKLVTPLRKVFFFDYFSDLFIVLQLLRFKKIITSTRTILKTHKNIIIELQHGVITPGDGYCYSKKLKNKIELPDYLITYGEYEKDLLTKKSIWNEDQIKALGCPRYDFLAYYKADKNKLKEKLKIPTNKKILFWPTQTHDSVMSKNYENELNSEEVFSTMKSNFDWFLIIKLHPNENYNKSYKFYSKYILKYNLDNVLILESDFISTYDCIFISNAVLIKHSTVGMESILLKKPVINFELKISWNLDIFKNLKTCLIIKEKGNLNKYLNTVTRLSYLRLFFKERDLFYKKHFANFGNSVEKVSSFLENVGK